MNETPAYFEKGTLRIRAMRSEDILDLSEGFRRQGWHKPAEQYANYLREQEAGTFRVIVAEVDGHAAGYAILAPQADHGPYAGKEFPEIRDINVLIPFQGTGIGGRFGCLVPGQTAASGGTLQKRRRSGAVPFEGAVTGQHKKRPSCFVFVCTVFNRNRWPA